MSVRVLIDAHTVQNRVAEMAEQLADDYRTSPPVVVGILNGAVVGIGFHWQLYVKYLKEEGAEFVMPWGEISLIVFGAYLLTLLATAWPVRKAASIHPAEALRAAE